MITVTKHGRLYQRGPIRCEFCGCEFKYNDSDIIELDFYYIDDYGSQEREKHNGIRCPECERNLRVERELQ